MSYVLHGIGARLEFDAQRVLIHTRQSLRILPLDQITATTLHAPSLTHAGSLTLQTACPHRVLFRTADAYASAQKIHQALLLHRL